MFLILIVIMVIDRYLDSHSLTECNGKCFSDIIGDYYVATLKKF